MHLANSAARLAVAKRSNPGISWSSSALVVERLGTVSPWLAGPLHGYLLLVRWTRFAAAEWSLEYNTAVHSEHRRRVLRFGRRRLGFEVDGVFVWSVETESMTEANTLPHLPGLSSHGLMATIAIRANGGLAGAGRRLSKEEARMWLSRTISGILERMHESKETKNQVTACYSPLTKDPARSPPTTALAAP